MSVLFGGMILFFIVNLIFPEFTEANDIPSIVNVLDEHQYILRRIHSEVPYWNSREWTNGPRFLFNGPQLRRELVTNKRAVCHSLRQYTSIEHPCISSSHVNPILPALLQLFPGSLVPSQVFELLSGRHIAERFITLVGDSKLNNILQGCCSNNQVSK